MLEVLLRFLPVSSGISIQPVNDQNPIFHAFPNKKIRYSVGWDFKNVRVKNINNAGFVSPQDYVINSQIPLLAVVGDSYVEAMIVQDHEAYPNVLQAKTPNLRVYSFGFSGAPLSQYLIWARYAKQNYNNDYLIINVVGNDFDESLRKYYSFIPGYYTYVPNSNGELQLQRSDWQPQAVRELAKKSYLLSYLVRNVEIGKTKYRIEKLLNKSRPRYVANTAADIDIARVNDSYQAIEAFFRDLPQYAGLDPKRIMFVIDDRTNTYEQTNDAALEQSYFHLMKQYFCNKVTQLGYSYIDLAVPFKEHYQQHGQTFEFYYDQHWNGLGHALVADTIMQSEWWNEISGQQHFFAG